MSGKNNGSPLRLAAIDVGSNSIRLVVAEVDGDSTYRVLDEEREMTRLAQGIEKTGRLSQDAMDRSIEAIGKMKAIAQGFQVRELRAVATSAVREAANGDVFCREVKRRHGLRVDVISTEEESRLAFESAARQFKLESTLSVVMDIGGGSVEIVFAAGSVIERTYSLPLGAVRMTEAHCKSDPLKSKHYRAMRRAIDDMLDENIGKPPFAPELMIGSGGTFTTLAEMIRTQREGRSDSVHGYLMASVEIRQLARQLRDMTINERRAVPGLNPTRADIIVAGAITVARIVEWLGVKQILVNASGVRDGLVLSMIADTGRTPSAAAARPTHRMDWVRQFAHKCRSLESHCEHIAMLAGRIFDGLRERFELPPESRDLLCAAALLHDVGYMINHAKHHKHTYHLILHGDLPGFSTREVAIIANVARYHRRAMPSVEHTNFRRLDKHDRRLVCQLGGILRIADGLDRTHTRHVTGITCDANNGAIRMLVEAETDPHVEIWYAEGRSELMQKAFDRRVEVVWSRAGRKRAARQVDHDAPAHARVV